MEEKHHLIQPLLLPSTTGATIITSSSSSTAAPPLDDHELNKLKLISSNSVIIFRLALVFFIGMVSIWANLESSKGFTITIVNESGNTIPGKRFQLFYVSNDEASRILIKASFKVENFLYPNDNNHTKKQVNHIILILTGQNLTDNVIVESIRDHEFILKVSPLLMEGTNFGHDISLALRRGMTHIWIWDSHGHAPKNLINGIVEYIASNLGDSGAVPSSGIVEPPRLATACWKQDDPRAVAEFLDYCEHQRPGFIRRLNQAMKNDWHDEILDIALGLPIQNLCTIYHTSSIHLSVGGKMERPKKKTVMLFYCGEAEELARNVAAQSDLIQLQSINWRYTNLFLGKLTSFSVKTRSFDDGFPNLFINNAHDIRGQHVAFLASFSSTGVIFEHLSVIYALPMLFAASFTVVLPFFPTGSFERIEEEGDVATAFTLARMLSNIPISRGGPTSLVVYDIHALQERFYFSDTVLPLFETGIPLLKQRLHQLPESDKIIVAFPDDGAWKRFHKLLDHFPMVICNKVREGDKRIVRIKEGEPAGCHVVIVDDLVQSGGTLIECQKVLAAHGAAKVSAYVTHGVFPKKSWERFVHKSEDIEKAFTHFWITDSCPVTVSAIADKAPFEVLSLAGSIANALQI
ncbi:hypothetical protein RD792_006453 [Penstemon davidsonii]|uniref:Phosphoribosyltransferase domain-containing protein n=1 Tax=Penstemon davidsonii TaxID=160366 RepID=A0ABR0DE91_9LAMI|nr:hypothetical protein RD792_006453 [Penstemon davidsonii]